MPDPLRPLTDATRPKKQPHNGRWSGDYTKTPKPHPSQPMGVDDGTEAAEGGLYDGFHRSRLFVMGYDYNQIGYNSLQLSGYCKVVTSKGVCHKLHNITRGIVNEMSKHYLNHVSLHAIIHGNFFPYTFVEHCLKGKPY